MTRINIKNVILVSMDATSPERLSCYGYARKTTPNIDKALTEGGCVFGNAFSQGSETMTGHASMLTSLYFVSHKVGKWTSKLSANITLGSVFKENGFETAGFTDHVYLSKKFGYATGFNTFGKKWRIAKIKIGRDIFFLLKAISWFLVRRIKRLFLIPIPRGKLEPSCAYGISWIKTNRKKPFFLFMHFFSAHPPYFAPLEYGEVFVKDIPEKFKGLRSWEGQKGSLLGSARKYSEKEELEELLRDLHDEEIAYNDHQIGILIENLKRLNCYNNTLIVITADHGNFLPRKVKRKETGNLFDDNVRVPLIFINPNLKPNQKRDCLAQVIDIFPTVLSLTGAGRIPDVLQGKSLVETILNNAPGPHKYIYANRGDSDHMLTAIRSMDWKFIYNTRTNKAQLYDLAQDSGELNNLADKLPEKFQDFLREYNDWINRVSKFKLDIQERDLSRPEAQRLRDLGYIE